MSGTLRVPEDHTGSPYSEFARLRATPGLVRHPTEGYYWVARHADVREAALRSDDFSSRIVDVLLGSLPFGRLVAPLLGHVGPVDVLAVVDAPAHRQQRKLSTPHFAREPVADVVARFRPTIHRRLDALLAARTGDFVARVAAPIPIEIALTLLGFPTRDAARVKSWVDDAVILLAGTFPPGRRLACVNAALRLYAYARTELTRARQRGGTGTPLGDALVRATMDGATDEREAASIVMQVLSAGADSTTSLLGNAAVMLANDPALSDTLRAEPRLIALFIEECLRLEAPFPGHFRVVRRPTELAGVSLQPGDRLMLLWASANRDETVFDEPDTLRLVKNRGQRPALAFGHGAHLCLGAGLARAVAQEVLDGLLTCTSRIALVPPGARLRATPFLRTHTHVPLRLEPSQSSVSPPAAA